MGVLLCFLQQFFRLSNSQCNDQIEEIELEICDQYTIQGDLFSLAVLKNEKVPTPLEDAVANMKVLEAIVQSADKENWVMP